MELDTSCGFVLHRGTSLCSLQVPRASACLQQPCIWAHICHSVGNLTIRRALQANPSCSLARLLSGGRNSPLLAGCHRLRRALPSQRSSCSYSPRLAASPHPAGEQSLTALLQGKQLLGCRTSPPDCRKALCKAATPGSALSSQPHPVPKALLAECHLAPEKGSPCGLFLIGGFLLLCHCILLPSSYFIRLVFNRPCSLPDLSLPSNFYYWEKTSCLQTRG